MTPAYRDREREILDARWFGDISNDEALKLLTELYLDWYEAYTIMRETEEKVS